MPGQIPQSQSGPCTSAVGQVFSQMMIVSAGRSNWAARTGGPVFFLSSAGYQLEAQLFIAYEIGIRISGSISQPSALSPNLGGLLGPGCPGLVRLNGLEGQAIT